MPDYEIELRVEGPLADSRESVQIISQELHRGMETSVQELERMVRVNTPRGVGIGAGLRGSIAGEVRGRGFDVQGVVGTPLVYGPVVELGRRPGQKAPPPGALDLWVQRILGVPPEEVKRAAFLIGRAIGRRGIPGRFMFKRAKEEFERSRLPRIIAQMGQAIATRLGGR